MAAVVDSLSDHTYDDTTVSSTRLSSGHTTFSEKSYDTLGNVKKPTLIKNVKQYSFTKDDGKSAGVNLDTISQLEATEAKLRPIKEYATGITFAPKLDEGMYLVGAGVRKKSIIKIYAVAMYASPAILNVVSPSTLGNAARTFNPSSPMTSFVLEMVYSIGAEKIASAIAESVKPRYGGSMEDISALESLIIEGVNKIGGQAIKGTVFRFNCSDDGVSVSANGVEQGIAKFDGLGSSFVDVFMDDNAVSPTLVDSCLDTWSSDEAKVLAASLLKLSSHVQTKSENIQEEDYTDEKVIASEDNFADKQVAIESKLNPIQEYATGVSFAPILDEGLYLVGAGVRKKSIIKIYAVAMYASATVLTDVSSLTLGNAARSFDALSPTTSFVLEMVYSVGAEKIAGAIGESVKPRYHGSPSDIGVLESLIIEGVNRIGGQAVKGTTFRFDCSTEGVAVNVDGTLQGTSSFDGLGSAFVDVFMDENAVSPTLFDSCVSTWSGNEAKALATSLLELSHSNIPDIDEIHTGDQEPDEAAVLEQQKATEAKLRPIKEYATGITFAPKLDEGMYLVGAGVRKKSIIKIYAVAMYASPAILNEVSPSTLGNAARTFNPSSPTTSFVLEMVYSIGAEKIAGALAESVKPRYSRSMEDISVLESLIIEGVNKIGGQATQGTVFRFDCSEDGVGVSVNGIQQGIAKFDGLGSAFVDVFMDDNAVSPTLVDSCLDTWSGDEAKLLAASLLEVSEGSRAENLSTTQDAELDEDEGEKVVEHELDVLYDTNPDVKRELVDQLPSAGR